MGKHHNDWQDIDYILKLFGERLISARRKYRDYVQTGIATGKRPDLIGVDLV